ncbi:MAG: hypothetical protein RIB84_22395 [Sneathiellaceae bacterium]
MAGRRKAVLPPAGHLDRRDRIWAAIRELKSFTWLQLSDATGLEPQQFKDYLQVLRLAGLMDVSATDRGKRAVWTLLKDTGVETPRLRPDGTKLPPSGQQRLWSAIRSLQHFDIEGLALSANVPAETAKRYATALSSAGYLVSLGMRRYRLLGSRVTGPRAPAIRRGKRVYDANLGREMTAGEWAGLPRKRS